MDSRISRVFFYHGIYYLLPSGETVAMIDSVVCETSMNIPDGVSAGFEGGELRATRDEGSGFQKGVVMA